MSDIEVNLRQRGPTKLEKLSFNRKNCLLPTSLSIGGHKLDVHQPLQILLDDHPVLPCAFTGHLNPLRLPVGPVNVFLILNQTADKSYLGQTHCQNPYKVCFS